jgi:hypothetical protein
VQEFGSTKSGEVIRACADAILNDFEDVLAGGSCRLLVLG